MKQIEPETTPGERDKLNKHLLNENEFAEMEIYDFFMKINVQ